MKVLGSWVDRWIIGSLNYMGVDRGFYRREVAKWTSYVDEEKLKVKWKKELKPYLTS